VAPLCGGPLPIYTTTGDVPYDDDSRMAEEWVQTDYRSFLTKLGVTTTESV
jgi:hypothetical protein